MTESIQDFYQQHRDMAEENISPHMDTIQKLSLSIQRLQENGVDISIEISPASNLTICFAIAANSIQMPFGGIITLGTTKLPFGFVTKEEDLSCQNLYVGVHDYRFHTGTYKLRTHCHNLNEKDAMLHFEGSMVYADAENKAIQKNDLGNVFNKENTSKRLPNLPKSTPKSGLKS